VAKATGAHPRRGGDFLKKKWIRTFVLIGLVTLVPLLEGTLRRPGRHPQSSRTDPAEHTRFLFGYLLGGLRAPVVGFYWLKVDLAYRKGRYFALEKDLRTLAELNPSSERVWDYAAWHQAFNAARRAGTPEAEFRCRYEGLELARRGLQLLPGSRRLLLRVGLIAGSLGPEDRRRLARLEPGSTPESVACNAFRRLLDRPDPEPEDRVLFAGSAERWAVRLLVGGEFDRAEALLREGSRELDRYRDSFGAAAAPPDVSWIARRALAWLGVAEHAAAARRAASQGDARQREQEVRRALARLAELEQGPAGVVEEERADRNAVREALGAIGTNEE
jgi:hypothetical protein